MADLVRYVDTASSGGDGTTQAHSGTNAAYASLAAWEAAEQADLTSTPDTMTVYCAGTQDSTALIISGWTTASGADITIAGDPSAPDSDGKNNGDAFSTSFYHLETSGSAVHASFRENYMTVDGIQFLMSESANGRVLCEFFGLASGNSIIFQNCRFRNTSSGNNHIGFRCNDTDLIITVQNCTSEWTANGANSRAYLISAATTSNLYNNTIEGASIGIDIPTGNSATIKNCCIFNNTDDINDVDGNSTISYCATDDGDGTNGQDMSPGGTESDGWNAAVTDYVNGDYTIKDDSSVLLDNGNSTGAPSTDINGTSWGTHDIGAFARTAAAAGQTVGTGLTSGLKLQRPKLVA